MTKVIYSGFFGKWSPIVEILQNKYNWHPQSIVTREKDLEYFKKKYNTENVYILMNLRRGHFPKNIQNKHKTPKIIFKKLSKYFINFSLALQGYDKVRENLKNKKIFFKKNLDFCFSFIKQNKPDLIVFYTWPHNSFDLILYFLAKKVFKIPALFIDPHEHLNKFYHIIGTDLEHIHKPIMKNYKLKIQKKNKDVLKYYNWIKKRADKDYKKDITDYMNRSRNHFYNIFKELIKILIKSCYNGQGFKQAPLAMKKKNYSFFDKKAYFNFLEYQFFLITNSFKTLFLKYYYKTLCVKKINDKEKFILFAASLQPEANSETLVGEYYDTFKLLKILTKSLPKGWKIYYKEHYSTFYQIAFNVSPLRKDRDYYLKLSKIPNVKLIPSEWNTKKLVLKSKAVSTLSGTIGIEAAVNNKPVLAFGNTWYLGCKSIFHIKNLNQCKLAIKKINNNFLPDQTEIKKYLYAIANTSNRFVGSKFLNIRNVIKNNTIIANSFYQNYNNYKQR